MAKARIKVPKKLVKEYRDTETKMMYCMQEASAAKFMGNKAQERSWNRDIPKLQDRMQELWEEIDKEVGGGLEAIKMLFIKVNGKKKFGKEYPGYAGSGDARVFFFEKSSIIRLQDYEFSNIGYIFVLSAGDTALT